MSIKSGLEKVLKEYLIAKENEEFAKNPLANCIRDDLNEEIEAVCGDAWSKNHPKAVV